MLVLQRSLPRTHGDVAATERRLAIKRGRKAQTEELPNRRAAYSGQESAKWLAHKEHAQSIARAYLDPAPEDFCIPTSSL